MLSKKLTMKEFLQSDASSGKENYTYCRKCDIKRPSRAHHCSTCNRCVIRMDHHCPWINNCVGRKNYKMFYLFVIHIFLLVLFIFVTTFVFLIQSIVNRTYKYEWSFIVVIVLCIVSTIFLIPLIFFIFYHSSLVIKNRTTLENIIWSDEKRRYKQINNIRRKEGQTELKASNRMDFNRGMYENIKEVFGGNIFMWGVPIPSSFEKGSAGFNV
eukprot:GHVP01059260.1.p1 GENE.GHVP01059260.1~~GHVP01059260.1.p1  ORF type:complete len:213 (+),score=11.10 GHVP01059260.1:294-932(+)